MQSKTLQYLTPLLLTSAIAGGILAILAPLGTGNFSIAARLSYWVGLCLAGGLGAGAAEYIISRRMKALSRWPMAAAQSIGATLLVSVFLFTLHPVSSFGAAALTLFYIWIIAMTISAVGALQKGKDKAPQEPQTTAPPPLISRLKPALRSSDIYALEAQDHYVRVITSGGEDLILMRLSDAAAEISSLAGLSPHRSWWVTQQGIESVTRREGKALITLKNGTQVPVSRGRMKVLRAANWL